MSSLAIAIMGQATEDNSLPKCWICDQVFDTRTALYAHDTTCRRNTPKAILFERARLRKGSSTLKSKTTNSPVSPVARRIAKFGSSRRSNASGPPSTAPSPSPTISRPSEYRNDSDGILKKSTSELKGGTAISDSTDSGDEDGASARASPLPPLSETPLKILTGQPAQKDLQPCTRFSTSQWPICSLCNRAFIDATQLEDHQGSCPRTAFLRKKLEEIRAAQEGQVPIQDTVSRNQQTNIVEESATSQLSISISPRRKERSAGHTNLNTDLSFAALNPEEPTQYQALVTNTVDVATKGSAGTSITTTSLNPLAPEFLPPCPGPSSIIRDNLGPDAMPFLPLKMFEKPVLAEPAGFRRSSASVKRRKAKCIGVSVTDDKLENTCSSADRQEVLAKAPMSTLEGSEIVPLPLTTVEDPTESITARIFRGPTNPIALDNAGAFDALKNVSKDSWYGFDYRGNWWTIIPDIDRDVCFEAMGKLCHSRVELLEKNYTLQPRTSEEFKEMQKCYKCYQKVTLAKCTFHPGRCVKISNPETHKLERHFTCCEIVNANVRGRKPGCTTEPEHSPEPLDDLEQNWAFSVAPDPSPDKPKRKAIVVDCEMGGSQFNRSELIQLSVVDFFTSEVLINSLVKPALPIIEWRTQYSGIDQHAMDEAIRNCHYIDGWREAREMLFDYIDTDTIIIGHSLHMDLDQLRLIHTLCLDSALLIPRLDGCKHSVKSLNLELLDKHVQRGDHGHDCLEDVYSARELIIWCLRNPSAFVERQKAFEKEQQRNEAYNRERRLLEMHIEDMVRQEVEARMAGRLVNGVERFNELNIPGWTEQQQILLKALLGTGLELGQLRDSLVHLEGVMG